MTTIGSIAVLGLGKVGNLVATLLVEGGFAVRGVDVDSDRQIEGVEIFAADLANPESITASLAGCDAVVSCLPYNLNIAIADVAAANGLHYFDLTEDVPTTDHIRGLTSNSEILMAPQCGLAPGFISIVGASLAAQLDSCRSLRLRVGALPQNPTGLLGYAFNWSAAGVVNEYLNDCEVIEEGVRKFVSPMEWHEIIHLNGTELEAFTTSGGLGTMCETMLDSVDNLDYKSLRYPGHMIQMNFFFHELLMREDRAKAQEILTTAKPPVDADVVHVHVAAEGTVDGALVRKEFVRSYLPMEIAGESRTAISWTTAASLVAVVEMANSGGLPERGFVHQEHIRLDDFFSSRTGRLYDLR
ncbi:MAG: saccharopine dehydrogenase-like NADP-dependent oxidoreductase [Verrucomicrobiales bacterium]|jgi:saccharopine dehydrogenase-like NADP-dependent oxidoreductase